MMDRRARRAERCATRPANDMLDMASVPSEKCWGTVQVPLSNSSPRGHSRPHQASESRIRPYGFPATVAAGPPPGNARAPVVARAAPPDRTGSAPAAPGRHRPRASALGPCRGATGRATAPRRPARPAHRARFTAASGRRRTVAGMRMSARRVLALAAGLALALAVVHGAAVAADALIAVPALLLLVPLAAGRYVGEERIARLSRCAVRPARPRPAKVVRRRPRARMARGGLLIAVALARRGPPLSAGAR